MEILACILGFLVVIILVYRDWSVYLSTFAGVMRCCFAFWQRFHDRYDGNLYQRRLYRH